MSKKKNKNVNNEKTFTIVCTINYKDRVELELPYSLKPDFEVCQQSEEGMQKIIELFCEYANSPRFVQKTFRQMMRTRNNITTFKQLTILLKVINECKNEFNNEMCD